MKESNFDNATLLILNFFLKYSRKKYRLNECVHLTIISGDMDELFTRIAHVKETLKKISQREGKIMRISSLRIIHILLLFLFYQILSLILKIIFQVSYPEEHVPFLAASSKHHVSIGNQREIKVIWNFFYGFDLIIPNCSINSCVKSQQANIK